MKIHIEDCYNDLELEEFLEPTHACYEIRQGDNTIQLSSYVAEELARSIQFILHRNNLCKCQLES